MGILLFEQYTNKDLYRGISKQELLKSCYTGTLIYGSSNGGVILTSDINIAKYYSNYVVKVTCGDVIQINTDEYRSKQPSDCVIELIYEFDTTGEEIGVYTIDDFLKIIR